MITPPDQALSVDGLMGRAEARAGTSDWGDLAFRDTLELWLDSCRSTAHLREEGVDVLGKVVYRHLMNRLQLRAHCRAHPSHAEVRLTPGIVVTGMPRTGTTLLHNLLALDPANRSLRLWEALHPAPPDGVRVTQASLITQAERWLEKLYELAPAFRSIHGASATGPEECDALFQNDFASQHFDDMFDATSYSAWLNSADLSREYASYALQLRVLQAAGDDRAERPRPWALKSPSHLGHLGELLDALPDALVVVCHRHPRATVASYASLVLAVRAPYTARLSPATVGEQALRRSAGAMARALAVRETAGETRLVDVAYRTLVTDPLSAVRAIYERAGREISGAFEAGMRQWLAENPRHRHGVHSYSLGQFRLTEAEVDAAFVPYLERFSAMVGS